MKIGILTFHRAHNYGAVLQCYALQEVLKKMGHDVEIIDYRQRWVEAQYAPFDFLYVRRKIKSIKLLVGFILFLPNRIRYKTKRARLFKRFTSKYLTVSKRSFSPDVVNGFEVYIVGSDQVWSTECCGGRLDQVYLGHFKRELNSKLVGYAISTNRSSMELLKELYASPLQNFTSISFREEFAIGMLEDADRSKTQLTIDPTLLLDRESWNAIVNTKYSQKKYVVLYQVRSPQGRHVLYDIARYVAEQNRCEVIDLSSGDYEVVDFVSIIKFAHCVITSSFHATVFSLIFNTPFYCYALNDGNDSRYVELLNRLNFGEKIVPLDFYPLKCERLDENKLNESLNRVRIDSLNFLSNSFE